MESVFSYCIFQWSTWFWKTWQKFEAPSLLYSDHSAGLHWRCLWCPGGLLETFPKWTNFLPLEKHDPVSNGKQCLFPWPFWVPCESSLLCEPCNLLWREHCCPGVLAQTSPHHPPSLTPPVYRYCIPWYLSFGKDCERIWATNLDCCTTDCFFSFHLRSFSFHRALLVSIRNAITITI